MAVVVGSYGLIEDTIEWHVTAGADSYAGPFALSTPAPGSVPIDLTGYTAACEVRIKAGETLLARLTTENDGIELGGALGTVLLRLPASVSSTWTADVKKGVFDIELYSTDNVTVLGAGTVVIRPNITTGA